MNKDIRNIAVGLAFLGPNILGFLAFTLVPLLLSLAMAFTNWDLRLHNIFKHESIRFVGLDNFRLLLSDGNFWHYLGNTLVLMIGLPLSMAGSLGAALLLHQPLKFSAKKPPLIGAVVFLFALSLSLLFFAGMGMSSVVILLGLLAGLVFFGGVIGRETLYRTLFYAPHFTAGVATFVLWKKLFSPDTGPINAFLQGPLSMVGHLGRQLPGGFPAFVGAIGMALLGALVVTAGRSAFRSWKESDWGSGTLVVFFFLIGLGLWLAGECSSVRQIGFGAACLFGMSVLFLRNWVQRRRFELCPGGRGARQGVVGGILWMIAFFLVTECINALQGLPQAAASGLKPPDWLADYYWAKPSLIIIALWAAIGSNQMILYLAALSNVPVELEEAARIDGASSWQKFANVTWPQLAPVTFFVFTMGIIHGLQGGFEMARVLTKGGPAGATTTLSYYIYTEGFETGRLGFASAISWTLFILTFAVTLFNWRFGNRHAND